MMIAFLIVMTRFIYDYDCNYYDHYHFSSLLVVILLFPTSRRLGLGFERGRGLTRLGPRRRGLLEV